MYETSIISNLETNDIFYTLGFRNGDEIISVNGEKTLFGWDVEEKITEAKSNNMTFEVKRNGEKIELPATINYTVRGLLGVDFSETREVVYVYPNTPAENSEIQVGDIVIGINGTTTYTTDDIVKTIRNLPERTIQVTVLRNNEYTTTFAVETMADTKRHVDLDFEIIEPGFWKGVKYAIADTAWYFGANIEGYAELFTGKAENVEVMGVVGIASEISKTSAWQEFFYMMCAISLSLGIFNLLPIPALDGGRILLLIIEGIRRKPLSEKVEQNIILISFLIIILFAIFITFMDISKLF